jgi:uncharacterized delta-60 repeat protein
MMSAYQLVKLCKEDSTYSHLKRLVQCLLWCLCLVFTIVLLPIDLVVPLYAGFDGLGDLDSTFGTNGKVTTDFGAADAAFSLAIQPDRKITVAGLAYNGSDDDFALVRYNSDGSLDTAFGTNGKVTTDFDGEYDSAHALALQPDGKIVVVGYADTYPDSDFALVRYNSDGSLDQAFDNDGKVRTDFGGVDYAFAVAIQPDSNIVLAGYTFRPTENEMKIAVARYNLDGSLDATFDSDGKAITAIGKRSSAFALALQSDGKIVVAGDTYNASGDDVEVAVVRYNHDGSLDTTFDNDGIVTTDFTGFYDTAFAVTLQTDGKLVVAGSAGTLPNTDCMLARYNSDGSLDVDFGNAGRVVTDLAGYDDATQAVAQQADRKLILAGYATITPTSRDFFLARYTSDGNLDPGFGMDGVSITDFSRDDTGQSIALQTDGRIMVAGTSGFDFALARYQNDTPQLPPRIWLPIIIR